MNHNKFAEAMANTIYYITI